LRCENEMLKANFYSVLVAVVLSITFYLYLESVASVAFAAFVTMVFRVYTSEHFIRTKTSNIGFRQMTIEILIYCFFLLTSFSLDDSSAFFIYLLFCLVCFVMLKSQFFDLANRLKKVL